MVGAFFDSAVLVKNYYREPNSPEAVAFIMAERLPLSLTPLQEAEVRNSLRLKLFRKELMSDVLRSALLLLDRDIAEGIFQRVDLTTASLFRRLEGLSRDHSAKTGARVLDLLHVASALELNAQRFISFDRRQRTVADRVGLTVLPSTI